jgi:hypothetical protein
MVSLQLVGEVIKTRFFGLLSTTLTGESQLMIEQKPGFSDSHLDGGIVAGFRPD